MAACDRPLDRRGSSGVVRHHCRCAAPGRFSSANPPRLCDILCATVGKRRPVKLKAAAVSVNLLRGLLQPCEPQGWCRVESFSLHLRRGVNDEIFLLRSTFPHQRCYISTTREPSVPVACGCIPCAPQARPPAPCSVRLLTCRIHFCAKSRPLGETITDPVSQPHYASCLAGPSERITKA
jgi:hypothetical protein